MKFNIPERISILNILPEEGDVVLLRVLRELQTKVGFTAKEIKDWKIRQEADEKGRPYVLWDNEYVGVMTEIPLNDVERGIITDKLKLLNTRKMLNISMLGLYEKFVDGKEDGTKSKDKAQ